MFLTPFVDERSKELLPLHVITVGTDFNQPPSHRPDGNPFHHIFFVEKGEGIFKTATGEHLIGAGSAMFMRRDVPIHYERHGDCFRTGWVTFDGPAVDALLSYFRAGDFCLMRDEGLITLLRGCARAAERGVPAAVLSGLAYELIVTFFERLEGERKPSALIRAKDFIRQSFANDLSVSDIAAAAGVSESLLYRLFRVGEGSTPVEYLRRVRLERAKRYLLEVPRMRVSEIAALCGFSDFSYFCKVFRDSEQTSPKAYRSMYMS